MPFAQLNGQKIHYRDSGGRGPVVVLSHGFLMDSTNTTASHLPIGIQPTTAWRS